MSLSMRVPRHQTVPMQGPVDVAVREDRRAGLLPPRVPSRVIGGAAPVQLQALGPFCVWVVEGDRAALLLLLLRLARDCLLGARLPAWRAAETHKILRVKSSVQ